jgi:hypothetical protein
MPICKALSKKLKLKCRKRAKGKKVYCDIHKDPDKRFRVICIEINGYNGKRCKNEAKDGKEYCRTHEEKIRNRCEVCKKNARYNLKELDHGIRCRKHKIKDGIILVNIFEKQYACLRFKNSVEKFGGKVVGEYVSGTKKVECVCSEGHTCFPIPTSIQQGFSLCKICIGVDSDVAKKNFFDNIEKFGGKVVGKYDGNAIKVECECKYGHRCFPLPNSIGRGQGMCCICSGKDSETAKKNFIDSIEKLGGKILGEYVSGIKKVECVCSEGHTCFVKPTSIQQGKGMCCVCSGFKSEKLIIQTMERLTGHTFLKVRPSFLKYDKGFPLELDGYCKDLQLAVEVQGSQHYEYNKFFHRGNMDNFHRQKEKDLFKVKKCKEQNIDIVTVPTNHKHTKKYKRSLEEFLISEIKKISEIRLKNSLEPITIFEK